MNPVTLAETVRNAVFGSTQFRPGYDEGAVDDLLDELVRAVEAGSSSEVVAIARNAQLPMTSMRRGYDCGNVDDFLDDVVRQASDTDTDTVTMSSPAPRAPVPVPASQERSGFGARLLRAMRGE